MSEARKLQEVLPAGTPNEEPHPGERRRARRVKFYLSENVRLEIHSAKQSARGFCADLSAEGFSALIPETTKLHFQTTDWVQAIIHSPEGSSSPLHARIQTIGTQRIGTRAFHRIGLSILRNDFDQLTHARIIGQEVHLDEFSQPSLIIRDHFKVNSLVLGRVTSIARDGITFIAKNRDHVLLQGIHYRIKIQLPVGKEIDCEAELIQTACDRDGGHIKGVMRLGGLGIADRELLSQTCIIGSDSATPESLREIGMFVGSIESSTLEMTYPSSETEYTEMLELRKSAYQGVGKFLHASAPRELWDEFDEISRHLLFRVRGRIVGAIRVVFCQNDLTRSEHYQWGVKIPKRVRKAGFVEVSRASVDEAYRATDIFAGLIRQTIRLAVENRVRYVVVSCNPGLVSTYRAIGGQVIGKPFSAMGRDDCRLILFDIPRITLTSKGSVIAFHLTSYPLFAKLFSRNPLQYLLLLPNLILHRMLGPVFRNIIRRTLYRRFKKRAAHD
jgi:N-acyl-L-homoserine lactone synthetase